MINTEKGHVFFWRSKDFSVLRSSIALLGTVALGYFLLPYIPLPFVKTAKDRQLNKAQRILNSQNLEPLAIVSADQLSIKTQTSHFSYNDPLNLAESVHAIATQKVEAEYLKLIQGYNETAPKHEIAFQEVPLKTTKIEPKKTISASIPNRSPSGLALPPQPTPEFAPLLTFSPKPPLSSPPLPELPAELEAVTFHLSITPEGKVSYALPYAPNFRNKPLEKWLQRLQFPSSGTETSYLLKIEMVRK